MRRNVIWTQVVKSLIFRRFVKLVDDKTAVCTLCNCNLIAHNYFALLMEIYHHFKTYHPGVLNSTKLELEIKQYKYDNRMNLTKLSDVVKSIVVDVCGKLEKLNELLHAKGYDIDLKVIIKQIISTLQPFISDEHEIK